MEKQIGQQIQVVSKLESQVFVKLPLQAMLSRENKYVITLEGGKSLGGLEKYINKLKDQIKVEVKTSPFMIEPSRTSQNMTKPFFMPPKVNSQPSIPLS